MTHSGASPDSNSSDDEWADEVLKLVCEDVLTLARRKAPYGTDPEDLTQETCLRFLEATAAKIEISEEKAWCQQVLINICADLCRREMQRGKQVELKGLCAPQDAAAYAALAYAAMGEFRPTLPAGQLRIFDELQRGNRPTEVARELRVSVPYVSKTRRILRKKFGEFLNRRLTQHDYEAVDGTDRRPPRKE